MQVTRLAILAAEFNKPLIDGMIAAARAEAGSRGVEVVREVRVQGCYEVPLIAAHLLSKRDVDVLVVLGYIEKGHTQHGEVMGHVVHQALVGLQLQQSKALGIGIIGPGATAEQATERRDAYARSAVTAALANHALLGELVDKPKSIRPIP